VNDLVKSLVFEVVVSQVLSKILLAAPFLAWPIVNPIFVLGFKWVAGKIYDEMALVISFQMIALKTDEQVRKYGAVVKEIQAIQERKEALSEEKRKEYRERLADLIRLRP